MAQFYDTLLAEYVKNPGVRGLGLDKLAENQLDYKMIDYKTVTQNKKLNFVDVDLQTASVYSTEDVVITHKIYKLQTEETLINGVLNDIDIPLMHVLKNIEINGVYVNRDILKEIGTILENEIRKLETEIIELAGEEFNIKSPKQVGEILFGKLECPRGKKTKTGWSVNAEVLKGLAKEYDIAQKIIDFRHYSKLLSTYIVGLLELINHPLTTPTRGASLARRGEVDLIHTNYNQAVTATGRLSSTQPNLQNIPSGKGIAGEIRSAFVSRFEGGKIMAIDYSQVEVRLLAIMSGDENLLSAFKNGEDIHEKTAKFLGGDHPQPLLTKEGRIQQRKIAKAVNFGVIYGISGFGLAKMIDISVSDGNKYIQKFYENYPKVKEYFEKIISDCEEKGYVETMFGRRRYIKGITDRNKMIKSGAEREAINMPIQGSSADIIKIAMIRVDDFLNHPQPLLAKEGGILKTKLIMQVHDELVFDIFPGEEKIIEEKVGEIMENILQNKEITLTADCKIGESWKETK